MMLCLYMCILMGKCLAVFLNSFLLLQRLKMQKTVSFFMKNGLRVVFIKLTFRWLQTGLSDLKNTEQFGLW